jgi:methylated-DNA-protein-cysteine methyltransferase-like protein
MEEDNFFEKVYEVVKRIPYGKVTSYGAIAEYLGARKSARMVGWALNSKKYDLHEIPAHRVVNRNGLLTGKRYFGGENTMKELLENERVCVENNRIVDFEKVFWKPE